MKINRKKAVLSSIISIFACVAMLVGTTFAWFTANDSISGNEVIAGTLDVEIVDASGNSFEGEGTALKFVKSSSAPSGEAIRWEPGCSYSLTSFKVKNNGDLALTYKFEVSGLTGTDAGDLKDAINWSFKVGTESYTSLDGVELNLAAGETSGAIVITGTMDTSVTGENIMGKSLEGITIKVYAKQAASEYDSTGNTYDSTAQY